MLAEANATLWPSLITVFALILYFVVTLNVGRARAKYKVSPPQMSGNPDFERVVRVQQNTVEQLILFLPALWLFAQFISPIWAAGIGAVWIIGRILFAWGYYQAAEKRAVGFGISSLATLSLLGGSLTGIIMSLLKSYQL
jgi:glutathione S-transferase